MEKNVSLFEKLTDQMPAFEFLDELDIALAYDLETLPNQPRVRSQGLAFSKYTFGDTKGGIVEKMEKTPLMVPPSRLARRYVTLSKQEATQVYAGPPMLPTKEYLFDLSTTAVTNHNISEVSLTSEQAIIVENVEYSYPEVRFEKPNNPVRSLSSVDSNLELTLKRASQRIKNAKVPPSESNDLREYVEDQAWNSDATININSDKMPSLIKPASHQPYSPLPNHAITTQEKAENKTPQTEIKLTKASKPISYNNEFNKINSEPWIDDNAEVNEVLLRKEIGEELAYKNRVEIKNSIQELEQKLISTMNKKFDDWFRS